MTEQSTDHKANAVLEGYDQTIVKRGLVVLQAAIAANNYEKGWRTPDTDAGDGMVKAASVRPASEHVALLHSEVTEVFEAFRNGEPAYWYEHTDLYGFKSSPKDDVSTRVFLWTSDITADDVDPHEKILGKPQGMASELADIVIRVLDMADELELPVVQAILEKHAYNQTRPYRHGGKLA